MMSQQAQLQSAQKKGKDCFNSFFQAKLSRRRTKPIIITDIPKLRTLTKTNPKMLSNLWIAPSLSNGSDSDRAKVVHFLVQELKTFKSLTSLTLDFSDFGDLNQQDITMLTQGLEDLKSLLVLTVCFPEEMNDQLVKAFFSSLKVLKILSNLTLDFSECEQASEEIFKPLLQILKDLRKLEHLSLDFSCCINIDGRGLTYLFERLLRYPSLKDLDIILPEIRNDRWLQRLNPGRRKTCSLSSLALDFPYCEKISQKGIQNLTQILKNNSRSLRDLSLNFGACQGFPEIVMKELYFSIKELKTLSSLELRLNPPKETDQALALTLFASLVELKENLRTLALTLPEVYKIEEAEMKTFLWSCSKLKNLETLSIELCHWEDVSDRELENLSNCLGELSSLSTLTINFDKSSKVTPKRFNSLVRSLKDLPNSSRISFNNDECKIVNGVSVDNISLVEC